MGMATTRQGVVTLMRASRILINPSISQIILRYAALFVSFRNFCPQCVDFMKMAQSALYVAVLWFYEISAM